MQEQERQRAYQLEQQGLLGEAERVLRSAGPSYELASFLERTGSLQEACQVYRDLLDVQARESQPERVSTCEMLADLLGQLGHIEEALQLHQRSLDYQVEQLGPTHPELANTHRDRARLLNRHGRHSQAEQAYRQMLDMRLRCHGPSHPALIPGLIEVADFLSTHTADGRQMAAKARALIEEFELGPGPLHQLLDSLGE